MASRSYFCGHSRYFASSARLSVISASFSLSAAFSHMTVALYCLARPWTPLRNSAAHVGTARGCLMLWRQWSAGAAGALSCTTRPSGWKKAKTLPEANGKAHDILVALRAISCNLSFTREAWKACIFETLQCEQRLRGLACERS